MQRNLAKKDCQIKVDERENQAADCRIYLCLPTTKYYYTITEAGCRKTLGMSLDMNQLLSNITAEIGRP